MFIIRGNILNLLLVIDHEAEKGINQSVNMEFVGCRYMTRPGAPTIVSGNKHDQKLHS